MPNLVGIGLSQVPTNSMLGGLAYQDPEHASIKDLDLKNLSQINSEITDTAVDVFVYDTRKDSDGGAWRKRTQHTSWYNETLNTATRGSRREFPAVAVIVAQETNNQQVVIYDGDDPDLPMWMVFERGGNNDPFLDGSSPGASFLGNYPPTSVSAFNGIICAGSWRSAGALSNLNAGLRKFSFIEDSCIAFNDSNTYKIGDVISNRNVITMSQLALGGAIVNVNVRDVAMTVLPNAPIDDTTGLPVPTIAVATDGGVSVIKDDGTVSDLKRGSTSFTNSVQFTDNNSIMLVWGHAADAIRHINHYSYADWQSDQSDYDQSTGYHELPQFGSSALQSPLKATASGIVDGVLLNLNGQNRMSAKWDNYGLKIADLNDSDRANGMVCHIRSDSNSGWMHGDIKGAFLSDTDTNDAVGTELHPNGNSDFSSTDVSYISNTASGTATVTNGQLVLSGGTSGYSDHIININTVVGQQYVISIDYVTNSGNNGSIGMYVNSGYLNELNDSSGYIARSTGNTYTWYFTADNTTETIDLVTAGSTSNTYTFDNWTIKAVEEDRSVNNNGLRAFGTVPKQVVATGADLVGYGPFSDSNYLRQPYNSDLNFGTGAFSIMFWIKSTTHSVYSRIMNRVTDINDNRVEFYSDSGTNLVFYTRDNASATSVGVGNGTLILNQWHCIVGTRESSGRMTIYIDGIERATVTDTTIRDLTSSTAELIIGNGGSWDAGNPFPGQLSLLRISESIPSPEQIKKMYEDEKHLFQENAKATLYGSSDAVTALAYDDSTNLLYAGTSSGRSEFQGLCRINNTTEAVTTAISASNGLVAEQ